MTAILNRLPRCRPLRAYLGATLLLLCCLLCPGGTPRAAADGIAFDGTSRELWTSSSGQVDVKSLDANGVIIANGSAYGPYRDDHANLWNADDLIVASDGTSRLLWTSASGEMIIWALDANGIVTAVGPVYGPYADADNMPWAVQDFEIASDGTSRVLWTSTANRATIWKIDAAGKYQVTGPVYGPAGDGNGNPWQAKVIKTAPDGTSRLGWTTAAGELNVWSVDTNCALVAVGPMYGPFPDSQGQRWKIKDFAIAPDGTARLLWASSNDQIALWTMDGGGRYTASTPGYGPYTDNNGAAWAPHHIAVGTDGTSRVLWVSDDQEECLWTVDASLNILAVGPAYGPYTGANDLVWQPLGIAVADDGTTRLLWVTSGTDVVGGQSCGWSLDTQGRIIAVGPAYGPATDAFGKPWYP